MSDSQSPVDSDEFADTLILRDEKIVETVAKLESRIKDRFPEAGLTKLCGQLLIVTRQAARRSAWIERPILWIRVSSALLAATMLAILIALIMTAFNSGADDEKLSFTDFIQTFEAGVNEAIFIGAAIYFLISVETRIKRRRALAAVHELRAIAHIIDMHQLTKDPERVLGQWQGTANSPKPTMTAHELNRYLDYCSEMLSLTGKIAALYVRKFDDAVAVAAVSEVEQLSTGLSRKIWQKIMLLKQQSKTDEPSKPVNTNTVADKTPEPQQEPGS